MNDHQIHGDNEPASWGEVQKNLDEQLLEQIAALEIDTESPIAIGKEVTIKDDQGQMIKKGWIVDGYTVEVPPRGSPYVAAVVIHNGGKSVKKIALGTLKSFNLS